MENALAGNFGCALFGYFFGTAFSNPIFFIVYEHGYSVKARSTFVAVR
jgi:hypothetical protein